MSKKFSFEDFFSRKRYRKNAQIDQQPSNEQRQNFVAENKSICSFKLKFDAYELMMFKIFARKW